MLKDAFDFAEYQEKDTYGLGFKLKLTRKSDNSVVNRANAINNAELKINGLEWYVPHYTPSMEQRKKLSR